MVESPVFSIDYPIIPCPPLSYSNIPKLKAHTSITKSFKIRAVVAVSALTKDQTVGVQSGVKHKPGRLKRVFFLDVNPLCYKGSTPSLHSFAHWLSLFFSQVSITDPVIAVILSLPISLSLHTHTHIVFDM